MSNSPKTSRPQSRYQAMRELGRTQEGVCITYLAKDHVTQQPVILTRFVLKQLASSGASYETYQQQIQQLRAFNHPSILRYLDAFQTPDGFCLVQEYKQIQHLGVPRNWTLEQIKQISVSILEILVYLQNQTPPVLHRDLKPETLYVDAKMNVYLIDFGFALISGEDMPLSRFIAKKSGFVSPEQMRDRPVSEASDLYSLGVTIMCLLTQTESTKINTLIGQDGRINVKGLVASELSLGLIDWLETMVSPNPKQRYPNAITALESLKNIDVNRFPDVQFKPDRLEFIGNKFGEILTQSITIVNPITDTLLKGTWDIASSTRASSNSKPEPAWISFNPDKFEGNKVDCQISIDTSKLMVNKTYERRLLLGANSSQSTHPLLLKVKTAAIQPQKILYISLILLLTLSLGGGWLETIVVNITPDQINWVVLMIGLVIGCISGGAAAFSKTNLFVRTVGFMVGLVTIVGFLPVLGSDLDLIVGFFVGLLVAGAAGMVVKHHIEKNFSKVSAVSLSVLTAILGMSSGIGLTLNSLNPLVMLVIVGTGLPLVTMIIRPYLEYLQILHNYRKVEKSLMKP